jgi:flavodoxin
MKTVIVYESMYGNTRVIADAIAQGLGPECEAVVVPVSQAPPQLLDGAGLVVVGGPSYGTGSRTVPGTGAGGWPAMSRP